jgi:adenine-specific DNA-methyltransferase
MTPYYQRESVTLYHGDCLAVLPSLTANSVDLVLTDPPYFKVKNEAWDRQWASPKAFLSWLDLVTAECHRLLRPNGSLYCFASPQMAARVEVLIADRLNVLNRIRWTKDAGWHNKAEKESLRSFLSPWEEIVFAEHYGADNIAKGEAGYEAKCDELRGFVFEPLRAYLAGERDRAGWTTRRVAEAFQQRTGSRTVTGMAGHWFERVQWTLPTAENYQWLRDLFGGADEYLRREYEDLRREYEDLRREYEDLRREYEDLRRPFSVTADVPYTDVWDFKPVAAYPGKHPCEKPAALLSHMLTASSRPGAVVLDMFAGSGATLDAAVALGRKAVGVELSEQWCEKIARRLEAADTLLPLECAG